jgi:hypothetical protein
MVIKWGALAPVVVVPASSRRRRRDRARRQATPVAIAVPPGVFKPSLLRFSGLLVLLLVLLVQPSLLSELLQLGRVLEKCLIRGLFLLLYGEQRVLAHLGSEVSCGGRGVKGGESSALLLSARRSASLEGSQLEEV